MAKQRSKHGVATDEQQPQPTVVTATAPSPSRPWPFEAEITTASLAVSIVIPPPPETVHSPDQVIVNRLSARQKRGLMRLYGTLRLRPVFLESKQYDRAATHADALRWLLEMVAEL